MHTQQIEVQEYHEACGIPVGDYTTPQMSRHELRANLIREETKELLEAIESDDLAGACKEMCDVLVVVYGSAIEWGINLSPFWVAVRDSNMAKVGGPEREDGKKLKPEGWEPPDIAGILDRIVNPPEEETDEPV